MRAQFRKKSVGELKEPAPFHMGREPRRISLVTCSDKAPYYFQIPEEFLEFLVAEGRISNLRDIWYELEDVPSGSCVELEGLTVIDKIGDDVTINITEGPLIVRSKVGSNVKVNVRSSYDGDPAGWFNKHAQVIAQAREKELRRQDKIPDIITEEWARSRTSSVFIFADQIGEGLDITARDYVCFNDDVSVSDVNIICGGSVEMRRMHSGENRNVNASFKNANIRALLDIKLHKVATDTKPGKFQYQAFRDVYIDRMSCDHAGLIKAGRHIDVGNMSNAMSRLYAGEDIRGWRFSPRASAFYRGEVKTQQHDLPVGFVKVPTPRK